MNSVVLITTPTRKESERLTNQLLKQRLAACVNLLPVSSHYWWKSKIENVEETLMIVKTERNLINQIVKHVKKHHSYKIPEVIALPITNGNKKYLEWIAETVQSG